MLVLGGATDSDHAGNSLHCYSPELLQFYSPLRRCAICLRIIRKCGLDFGIVLKRFLSRGKIGREVNDKVWRSGPVESDLGPFIAVQENVAVDQAASPESHVDGQSKSVNVALE